MSKYDLVNQATGAMNDYLEAKRAGQMGRMQEKYNAALQAINTLQGLTTVQATRQRMDLSREEGRRAEIMFPVEKRTAEAQAGRAEFTLEQEQAEVQREAVGREQLRLIMSRPEIQDILPRELRGIPAESMSALAESFGGIESLLSLFANIQQKIASKEAEAKAAGFEAEIPEAKERKVGAEARLAAKVPEKKAAGEARALELDQLKTQLETGVTWNALANMRQDLTLARETKRAQLKYLKSRAEAEQVAEEVSGLEYMAKIFDVANPYIDDIFSAYKAMQSTIKSGSTNIFEQWLMMNEPGLAGQMLGGKTSETGLTMADIQKAYEFYINMKKDILSQLGFDVDTILGSVKYRGVVGKPGMTLPERKGTLKTAEKFDEGLKSAWEEPEGAAPKGPLGPTVPGEKSDIDTMLELIGQ